MIWDGLRWLPKPDKAYFVFTFDDMDRSQHTTALPFLREYGFQAGVGVTPDRIASRRMTLDELQSWHDLGHDMVSHSWDIDTLDTLSNDESRQRIHDTNEYMVKNCLVNGSNVFAYPGGKYTEDTIDIVNEYHELAYTTQGARVPIPHTSPETVARTKGDSLSQVQTEIDTPNQYNKVVTIYLHNVGFKEEI